MLVHRHLDVDPGTSPEDLPLDALDDLLDRGDFDDWQALATAVRRDPDSPLANRVLDLCRAHPMYGTSRLWAEYIGTLRAAERRRPGDRSLAELRTGRGLSQADVARRLGISQSDVSKLERRPDIRVSTLRRYVEALGGQLELTASFADGSMPIAR